MSFRDRVAQVLACPGVVALAIADREGIAVESWGPEAAKAEDVIAEYTGFLRELTSANRELKLGNLEQVVVRGGDRTLVVTFISPEYFLFAITDNQGHTGKVRFVSRLSAWHLRSDFV